MEATPEVDLWHTGPLLKTTDGKKCKEKHRST